MHYCVFSALFNTDCPSYCDIDNNTYIPTRLHICIYYAAFKYYSRYVCLFACMLMRFPLHCPGPGYWLLSRQVVPPPQSDHRKQLRSGESTHTIRHKKGHDNCNADNRRETTPNKDTCNTNSTYIYTYIYPFFNYVSMRTP